jgi:hypothetical protein
VAFVEEGKLLFDEPMEQLHKRFRAVRIVFDHAAQVPQVPPPDWFQVAADGNTLEYIDARYSENSAHEFLNARFHGIRSIETESVPLRTVFTALARAAREAQPEGSVR